MGMYSPNCLHPPFYSMKSLIILWMLFSSIAIFSSCTNIIQASNGNVTKVGKATNKKDSVLIELIKLWGLDQGIRNNNIFHDSEYLGYVKISKIDSFCFERAISLIKKYGWPTEQTVGDFYEYEETHALSPILLHSPHRLKNDSIYQLLKGEVIAKRLKPESLALFLDKYYVTYEKRSLYNSPFKVWTPAKGVLLKDKHLSDSLMKDIGLSPLPDSIYKK